MAQDIATDAEGNTVVVGYSDARVTQADMVITKYSSTGSPLWTGRYNGPANSDDKPVKVAVDAEGNIFVTGSSYGIGTQQDYLTIKYSSAGIPLWTNRYDGPSNRTDQVSAMAVDGSGNVIITGSSVGIGSGNDYATIKYSAAGVALWTNRYNGPGNSTDDAYAAAVDLEGNVYVTGGSVSTGLRLRDDQVFKCRDSAVDQSLPGHR